jgi:flagellar hook-length control protein FliK
MSEVQKLADLFANTRKDAQAKAAKSNTADAKSQPAARADSQSLLPMETSGKGKGAASTPSPFQSKVRESRAKLAAQNQKAPHQNRTPDLMSDKPAGKNDASRPDNNRSARAGQARPAVRKSQSGSGETEAGKRSSRPEGFRADANASRGQLQNRASDSRACDGASDSDAALKQSLEDAGIHASDEQLQDPDMLAEILSMLQGMFLQQGLDLDAAPDAAGSAGAEALPAEDLLPEAGSETVGTDKAAQTPAEVLAGRKDAFELIQAKLAQLAQNNADTLDRAGQPGAASQNTPAGWQGVKVRPQTQSVTTEPLPMADLDRLRVMQASALQASAAGNENTITSMALPGDEGDVDAIPESGIGGLAHAGKEASNEDDTQAQADLFGRNGDTARNAESSASKEGPLVAKDGATGQLFHSTLEQAKSVEHRGEAERVWEPRQAHDAGVMDQIAKKLSAIGHKNGDEINIQLSPEHLGKVRVSLEMKDGAMAARISVENDAVREQVEAGLASLRDSLENQGIKLQGLEVSVEQRQSSLFNPDGSNSESFFQRNGRGHGGSDAAAEAVPFESAPESDTGRRMGYNTMEYIG